MLLALGIAGAPHWAVALWTGASVLPDQSYNLAIAAGHPTSLFSWESLLRLPMGALRAAAFSIGDGWIRALILCGALGLGIGALRGDRRALGLGAFALAHLLLIGLAFANPRLVLPTTLALGLGWAFLLPRGLLQIAAAGLLVYLSLIHISEPTRPY